jgi:hypothetical protein
MMTQFSSHVHVHVPIENLKHGVVEFMFQLHKLFEIMQHA